MPVLGVLGFDSLPESDAESTEIGTNAAGLCVALSSFLPRVNS